MCFLGERRLVFFLRPLPWIPARLKLTQSSHTPWVRVCYFSGARKRNIRRREARKRVGLNSFLSMKKGMANYYYLCLVITWFFFFKGQCSSAQYVPAAGDEERRLLRSQATGFSVLIVFAWVVYILCGALSTCAIQPFCITIQKTIDSEMKLYLSA